MNHTTKAATLGIATAITIVTLALVTAGIVVSMMTPTIIQTAHASCIISPKGDQACSGGGGSCAGGAGGSCSISHTTSGQFVAVSKGSGSASDITGTGGHHLSNSHNFLGRGNCADTTCSGNK
jgi:hypothetical protein